MTVFSTETKRDIRNLATASLSMLAYQFQCEVSDILALLDTRPGQTSSHASAAPSPTTPPVDEEAGGSAETLQSDLPASPDPEAKTSTDGGTTEQDAETPADSVTGEVSRSDAGRSASATSEIKDVTAGETAPQHQMEEQADAEPEKRPKKDELLDLQAAHPNWPAKVLARALGVTESYVRSVASKAKLRLATQADFDAEQVAATKKRLAGLKAPSTNRAAQETVQVPPIGKIWGLAGRVKALKSMHPAWTPAMIAKELGVDVDPVLRALGKTSAKASSDAVGGEAAQRAHYADVAKRLGKV